MPKVVQFWGPRPGSSCDNYLVLFDLYEDDALGEDEPAYWIEMSANALDANGVNMMVGQHRRGDRSWMSETFDLVDNIRSVPQDIVRAALLRVLNS